MNKTVLAFIIIRMANSNQYKIKKQMTIHFTLVYSSKKA